MTTICIKKYELHPNQTTEDDVVYSHGYHRQSNIRIMVQSNLFVLVLVTVCALPKLLALPITSKPYARSPDHLAWDTFSSSGADPLDPSADGYEKPKKILPKSIFIAPTLNSQNSVTTCGPGYTTDHRGNCIQTFHINHNQLLLNQLSQLLASHQLATQQQNNHQQQEEEDSYDYDYDTEPTVPTTQTKEVPQKGPFQFTLPVQLEFGPSPQALQYPDPITGSTAAPIITEAPQQTTTAGITTSVKPLYKLTSFFEGLLPINRDPFGLAAKLTPTTTMKSEMESTTLEAVVETTTNLPTTVLGDQEEETTTNQLETGVTMPFEAEADNKDTKWGPSEFATELANEQLVPVTSTTTWDETTASDADDLLLSNAEGTTTYEVDTTETRDDMSSSNGATTPTSAISSSSVATELPLTTTARRPEVTETVLPVQVMDKLSFPTLPSLFQGAASSASTSSASSGGFLGWRSSAPISIVTPVPNPFPFQRRTTFGSGSLFKFTVPVTTNTTPRTTTANPTTTSASPVTTRRDEEEEEVRVPVPELLLAVSNESENSQKLRESLIESEQKEVNYENIDVNNRFIYHHLSSSSAGNPSTTHAEQPTEDVVESSSQQPIVVVEEEEYRILDNGSDNQSASTTTEKPLSTTTPSFADKLTAYLRPKESERRRVNAQSSRWMPSSSTPAPFSRSTTEQAFSFPTYSTATPSRFEEFLRTSSNRIRFPGPSVNRQPAPNKLIPNNGQVASRSGPGAGAVSDKDKDKKPFWWLPTGWEVDTKQKEKPMLLRFWSKMPLIPDSVAQQRRSHTNSNSGRLNRENSKSPSDDLYREVAFQDVSKAFQERQSSST